MQRTCQCEPGPMKQQPSQHPQEAAESGVMEATTFDGILRSGMPST